MEGKLIEVPGKAGKRPAHQAKVMACCPLHASLGLLQWQIGKERHVMFQKLQKIFPTTSIPKWQN